jgi:thymidylate kinase
MPKLTPKIILEGTRLTQKTDIAFALNEHPRIVGPRKYRYHSPLVSAEWGAFTNHPWGRGMINFEPKEEELAMEAYRTWVRLFELQRYYSWIIDRFHVSTQMYQQRTYNKTYDFEWLEERLGALDFRLVFCTRSPDSFAAARTERLKISGNPSQYDDLQVFIDEQEELRALIKQSNLRTLTVDVSGSDVARNADTIADWLEETGGLYSED